MLRFLQNYPHFLEITYRIGSKTLSPWRRWLKPGGWAERIMVRSERLTKGPIFGCKMCGQCVLHSTGMTCMMTCPKNLRNGPCGGVRFNGNCEVEPTMKCIWVDAWERSEHMPTYGQEIRDIIAPLNHQLHDTSAWVNEFTGVARTAPKGWDS